MQKLLRNFKIEHIWTLVVIGGVFVFVNTQPIRPHDFWWHLAIGREIASTGQIPAMDIYSFTMQGTPYPSYQMFWLADLLLYWIYDIGGPALVIFIQSILITSTYGFLFWLCWKRSKSIRIAAVVGLLAIALGINNWNVRPQTISYLMGVLFLVSIYFYRTSGQRRWLLIVPVGMLIWVNSHGSFIIGLVLIGIWTADEIWQIAVDTYHNNDRSFSQLWISAIVLLATCLVCFINPRGPGIIEYVLTLTGDVTVQNLVPEWAPPSFDNTYGLIFFSILMLSVVVLAVSPKRPRFNQLATFITFGLLAISTTRGVVWFGIVMAPILAFHLSAVFTAVDRSSGQKEPRKGKPVLNWLFVIVILAAAVISLPWFKNALPFPRSKAGLISSETPLEATDYLLKGKFPGEIFNEMGFGSYLIWAAYPDYQVFTDTRIELFPLDLWWDYSAIGNALPGWEALLEDYKINTLMLSPQTQSPLISAAEKSEHWNLSFEDQAAIIFTKGDNRY